MENQSKVKPFKQIVKQVFHVEDWQDDNRIRNIYSLIASRLRLSQHKYPSGAIIELTTRCDSKCVYCPRLSLIKDGRLKSEDMDWSMLEKLIHDLHDNDLHSVSFAGMGEGLLYPRFDDALNIVKTVMPKTKVLMFTNAITLDKHTEAIKGRIDELVISINSFTRENYLTLNGVDNFERVVQNAKDFLKMKGNGKPSIRLQLLVADANKRDCAKFKQYWQPFLNSNDYVIYERVIIMPCEVNLDSVVAKPRAMQRYPCIQPFEVVQVQTNGDLYPCCGGGSVRPSMKEKKESLCLGNIRLNSLTNMCESEKLRNIRHKLLSGRWDEIAACKGCTIWMDNAKAFVYLHGRWR